MLIPFMSDQLISFSNSYAPVSVDDLVSDIRRYLIHMYEHPGGNPESDEAKRFPAMHRYIYDNLANRDSELKMPPYIGDANRLSVTELRGAANLESNISNTINDRRALPKKWTRLLRSETGYMPLLYRCFWLLQYYFVYYARAICAISHFSSPASHSATQFVEYFPLRPEKSVNVFNALDEHCWAYSTVFCGLKNKAVDLISLSRIILDVIIEQVALRQQIDIDKIADASLYVNKDEPEVTELRQYTEFQQYVNGYGSDSYDRYNMLLKFAPTNCYAADELATMYYWGKTYWLSDNNYFELEQSYEKAAEWYVKAIENSHPPLQSSCWSLSYALTNIRCETEEERALAEKKAIEYLQLAGEYPAAYNRIAFFLFRDAEALYKAWDGDPSRYEDILVQLLSAIRLADRAGAMHWFYGNNQIASFLIRHEKDGRLLSDLSKRLALHVPFDAEAQLMHSVSYHNPWALKHLAIYYIDHGRKTEAKSLLLEAMDANYNAAYYEMARHFHKKGSEEWRKLMDTASKLSYPHATYELAAEASNLSERARLIALCQQQLYSAKQLDTVLLNELDDLKGMAP